MAYTQQPPYDHGEGSPTVTGETDPLPPPFPPSNSPPADSSRLSTTRGLSEARFPRLRPTPYRQNSRSPLSRPRTGSEPHTAVSPGMLLPVPPFSPSRSALYVLDSRVARVICAPLPRKYHHLKALA